MVFSSTLQIANIVVKEMAVSQFSGDVTLFPGEQHTVANAVPKRQKEFVLGRTLAREALVALGMEEISIPSNADRSPQWPSSIVGSISHCNSFCAVAVALAQHIQYLGLDIEELNYQRMDSGVIRLVCVEKELQWLSQFSGDTYLLAAMAIFSAKESWYKALYPIAKSILGFHSACVNFTQFDTSCARWTGVLLEDWGPFCAGTKFPFGHTLFTDGYVASSFVKEKGS